MKGWAKKMIWFFGFWAFEMADSHLYFLKSGSYVDFHPSVLIIMFSAWLVPLFYLKDDEANKCK